MTGVMTLLALRASPSWEYLLSPTPTTPSSVSTSVKYCPQCTSVAPLMLDILPGSICLVIFPFPSCPLVPAPQTNTLPSLSTQPACRNPAEIFLMFFKCWILMKVFAALMLESPTPNCPKELLPQANTSPASVNKREKSHPAATEVTRWENLILVNTQTGSV